MKAYLNKTDQIKTSPQTLPSKKKEMKKEKNLCLAFLLGQDIGPLTPDYRNNILTTFRVSDPRLLQVSFMHHKLPN